MISKRIKLIVSLINSADRVIDIGTDHAFLPIYLIKNNITKVADGSDISSKVIKKACSNVNKYNLNDRINLYVSDGLKNIQIDKYNTIVITGMGCTTIKNILNSNDLKSINKIIIQTNNNYYEMRKFLNSISYKITDEICIKDKNINYIIFKTIKGKQKLDNGEYLCGLYNKQNEWFYEENLNKYRNILKKVPSNNIDKIKEIENSIKYLEKYLSYKKNCGEE